MCDPFDIEGNKAALKTGKVKNFKQLMDWCSKVTKLYVRTNADTPEQTETAIAFGANGIGLTRTEHMFFEGNRSPRVARPRAVFCAKMI